MKRNKKIQNFSTTEVIILTLITFFISLIIGVILGKKTNLKQSLCFEDKYINNFIQNYNYIINNYYAKVDKEKLIDGAINGMVSSLDDPYSMHFSDKDSANFNAVLEGEYEGIGITVAKNIETNELVIASIFKNSPAYKNGLKVNDVILSVDNIDLTDKGPSDISNYVLKSQKQKLTLKVLRDGKQLEFNISKEKINIESVYSTTYEKNNKKIGYIYISVFASNTYKQFLEQLQGLESNNIDSLIIDVRQNTGGHLSAVKNILNEFLTKKQILYIIEDNGKKTKQYGNATSNKKYEIALMGDNGSASASEVLIGALSDNLGSYFIGEQTYGKGSVQELVSLSNGAQYKLTTQRWLTPNGNCVSDTKGIKPHKEVKMNSKYYETGLEQDDNQLQDTINYLSTK